MQDVAQFRRIRKQMPELIAEMKSDLSKKEHRFTREFFLSKREWTLNPSDPCLVYFENDHPNLQGKAHILENLLYVVDITPKSTPKYRMTEEFVRLVKKYG